MNYKLEIAIILFSNEGREINFQELKSGKHYLEQKELTPEFFWGATGGFELIVGSNKTIFKGLEFYVALEGIRFLLHSLYWLEGRENRYDIDQVFPESVVSRFPNQNFIKLSRAEGGLLTFSYQSAVPQFVNNRGNRFFNEELFLSKDWAEAARIGLKEYFDVLNSILLDNPEQEKSKILEDYLVKEWKELTY